LSISPDDLTGDQGSTSDGDSPVPGWFPTSKPDWWENASKVLTSPAAFVRGVIVRPIIRTILSIATTLIGGILVLGRGTQPGYDPNEKVWGLADILPAVADILTNLLAFLVMSYYDVALWVVQNIIPQMPGPIDGLIVTIVIVIELVLTFEILVRLTRGIMDGLPVLSGVETFLFG